MFFINLFQLYVWILLTTQSFFIAVIEDAAKAQASAFGATGMFVATFLMSLGGIWYDSMHKAEPTSENGAPEAEYHLATGDAPVTYGTSA